MTTDTTNALHCSGCGRADFKGAFGLKIHQTAPKADPACRAAAEQSSDVCTPPLGDPLTGTEIDAVTSFELSEFDGSKFRVVGAVGEFNPKYMDRPKDKALLGVPVKVTKVNPKSIMVVTPAGQRISTDSFMLVPTDKPWVEAQRAPVLGEIVRMTGKGDTLFVVIDAKVAGFKVAVLGGNDNRAYRGVPAQYLTIVDPSEVLK